MLLNDVVHVIVNGSAANDTDLGTAVHDLLVDVVASLLVLDVCAVDLHLMQLLGSCFIDILSVGIVAFFEAHLCAVDAHEGIGVAFDILDGFLCVHNVVGQSSYLINQLGCGANSSKGFYNSHWCILL